MRISITLPGFSCMVAVARSAARALLPGNPRADDAELIVSELATNAVRHSTSRGGQFELTLDLAPGRIRIEIKDGGPFGYPPPPNPGAEPQSKAQSQPQAQPNARPQPGPPLPPPPTLPIHPWTTMHRENLNRDRAAEAEEYGYGLALIAAASDRWGHSRYPEHAIWWAELTWSDEPAPAANPEALADANTDSKAGDPPQ